MWGVGDFLSTSGLSIQEFEGVTLGHISTCTPTLVKKSMTVWQVRQDDSWSYQSYYYTAINLSLGKDAYPQRPKGLHMLNMPAMAEAMVNLVRSLATEKIRSRLHVSVMHQHQQYTVYYRGT